MKMERRRFLTYSPLFGLAPFSAFPQSFGKAIAVQIGSESILIPTPVGFVETSRSSPKIWNTALAFAVGDARIMAHYVTEPDLKAFDTGKIVHFRQFMLVQTPKRAESLIATQAQFDKLRNGTIDLHRNLAAKLEPPIVAEIKKVSKAVSADLATNIKIRIGEFIPVSIDRNDAQVLGYTVLARVGTTTGTKAHDENSVVSSAYCFVNGKVVTLAAYRQFKSPQDLQTSRKMVDTWANALIATN